MDFILLLLWIGDPDVLNGKRIGNDYGEFYCKVTHTRHTERFSLSQLDLESFGRRNFGSPIRISDGGRTAFRIGIRRILAGKEKADRAVRLS
jgi:hypothetical protein